MSKPPPPPTHFPAAAPPSSIVGRARFPLQSLPDSVSRAQRTEKIANEAAKLAADLQQKGVLRKRKYLVYAVGFGVVTVACAILGQQLATAQEENEKRRQLKAAADELAATTGAARQHHPVPAAVSAPDTAVQHEDQTRPLQIPNAGVSSQITKQSAYPVDVARQITLLEDRKALLNRQRVNFEAKIEMLRQRRKKKEEMDARRPTQQKDG